MTEILIFRRMYSIVGNMSVPLIVRIIVYIKRENIRCIAFICWDVWRFNQSRNDQAVCVLTVLYRCSCKYSIQARATFPVLCKVTERCVGEGMRSLRNGQAMWT